MAQPPPLAGSSSTGSGSLRRGPALTKRVREWYLVPRPSWLVLHLRFHFALQSCLTFPGSDYLGPSEGLRGPNLPNSLDGDNQRREHAGATRRARGNWGMCDQGDRHVLRERVIAWWVQHGEKLDGTSSDLPSAWEKICSGGILAPSKQILWRELPLSMDRWPFLC